MQRRLAARCAVAEAALAEREQEVSALRTLLRQSRAAKAWKVRELEHESELQHVRAEASEACDDLTQEVARMQKQVGEVQTGYEEQRLKLLQRDEQRKAEHDQTLALLIATLATAFEERRREAVAEQHRLQEEASGLRGIVRTLQEARDRPSSPPAPADAAAAPEANLSVARAIQDWETRLSPTVATERPPARPPLAELHNELVCPLTLEPPADPRVCSDGHVYERAAIERWVNQCDENGRPLTSPVTKQPLDRYQSGPRRIVAYPVFPLGSSRGVVDAPRRPPTPDASDDDDDDDDGTHSVVSVPSDDEES